MKNSVKYLIAATVLGVVCIVGWNWYDVRIFLNWVLAVRQLSIVKVYMAYNLLGPQYRAVYPPIPILIFIVTSSLTNHLLAALNGLASDFASLARCYLMRLTLKLPLLISVVVTGYILKRVCKRSTAFFWFVLGVPTLITLATYQFDPLVSLLLLLSVLSLTKLNREYVSAVFLSLATLVKPLVAVFFLPIALYLSKPTRVAKYLAIVALVCFAVSAPFLVMEPRAFIENVIGFHMNRPPQYVSFWNIPVLLTYRNTIVEKTVDSLWLPIYIAILLAITWIASRIPRVFDERALLTSMIIVGIATLAFNKVVNPSYTLWIYPLVVLLAFEYGINWIAMRYNILSVLACLWPAIYVAVPAMANEPMYVEEVHRYISARNLLLNSLSPPINKSMEKILRSIDMGPLHRYTITLYHQLDPLGVALISIYVVLCMLTILRLIKELRYT